MWTKDGGPLTRWKGGKLKKKVFFCVETASPWPGFLSHRGTFQAGAKPNLKQAMVGVGLLPAAKVVGVAIPGLTSGPLREAVVRYAFWDNCMDKWPVNVS